MLHDNFLKRLSQASEVKITVLVMFGISVLFNLMALLVILALPKTEKTHWLPPDINKGFWVQGDKLSQEYIERMTWYVLQLQLNVTPSSVRYQGKMLLQVVDPRIHAALKKQIEINAATLERDGVATYFEPKNTYFDFAKYPNRMAYSGSLVTLLTDKQISSHTKVYMAEFGSVAGRTVLTGFRETTDADPLGIKPEAGTEESANQTNNPSKGGGA